MSVPTSETGKNPAAPPAPSPPPPVASEAKAGAGRVRDRDAVIFLPGIGDHRIDQSIDGIAARIADAMERELPDPAESTSYVVRADGQEEGYGTEGRRYAQPLRTRLRTICSRRQTEEKPELDVYLFDYRETLMKRHRELGLFAKALGVGAVIFSHLPRLLRAFVQAGAKSRAELAQVLITTGLMGLLVLYVGFLLVTLLASADTVMRSLANPGGTPAATAPAISATSSNAAPGAGTSTAPATRAAPAAPAPAGTNGIARPEPDHQPPMAPAWVARGIHRLQQFSDRHVRKLWGVFVFLSGIGLFQPRLRELLIEAAVEYTCVAQYLETAQRQSAVGGQFTALIDHLVNKGRYRKIHVVGFSFGSVVALDALFPKSQSPPRCCDHVATLTTIGSPFDLIRSYYPAYFEERHAPGSHVAWFNVYMPADVFGSNFRNSPDSGAATNGVRVRSGATRAVAPDAARELMPENLEYGGGPRLKELSWIAYLLGIGLRAHTMYWEEAYESEYSCFHLVVRSLYDPDRSPPPPPPPPATAPNSPKPA